MLGLVTKDISHFFSDSIYIAQEHPIAGVINKGIVEYDILCDVKSIPLIDNSVDLILSTSSLEHIEFPDEFFSEANRVLKPGGALYINVPFIYSEHEIPYDFQRQTRYGLERHYKKANFEIYLYNQHHLLFSQHNIFFFKQ